MNKKIRVGVDLGGTIAERGKGEKGGEFFIKKDVKESFDILKDYADLLLISKAGEKVANKSKEWLEINKLTSYFREIYFEKTKDEKINRILSLNLDFFIDDKIDILIELRKGNKNINLILLNENPKIKNYKGVYIKFENWKGVLNYICQYKVV